MHLLVGSMYLAAGILQLLGVTWVIWDVNTLSGNRAALARHWEMIDDAAARAHRHVQESYAESELKALAVPFATIEVRLSEIENRIDGFYRYDEANQEPSHSARMTISVLGGGVVLAAAASVLSLTL
ncbi:hypothetical protein FK268_16150 [Tsukamurella sputi]|uniref:Uncharacterized protein n=1 Tax=Tsukamurella sputi TaxID=2591848 RepID=A0A5C5RJR2_9ACTN|nr:hypothetical protein [Tsukamurella sputi]TWS22928.1 hypothetical protein FK268_16150 [Tsukamurella sputi]